MKKILLAICICFFSITDIVAQNISVSDVQNLIVGTWYRDFSTYSEPQNIVPIDTSYEIVYDQDNVYYYENNQLVAQCWYEIRNTDCDGNVYSNKIFLVTPDITTNDEICTEIENITEDDLILWTEGTAGFIRYVKK